MGLVSVGPVLVKYSVLRWRLNFRVYTNRALELSKLLALVGVPVTCSPVHSSSYSEPVGLIVAPKHSAQKH
jgi:hypothetical protein